MVRRFGERVRVYTEVPLGSSIIGKQRRVDLLVVSGDWSRAVALQAKFQDSPGTTDEKIHYALADCAAMHVPAAVVYGGRGWSAGISHVLAASPHAVSVELMLGGSFEVADARELDVFLAGAFGFWNLVVDQRTPFTLPPSP